MFLLSLVVLFQANNGESAGVREGEKLRLVASVDI